MAVSKKSVENLYIPVQLISTDSLYEGSEDEAEARHKFMLRSDIDLQSVSETLSNLDVEAFILHLTIHEARILFLRSLGYKQTEICKQLNLSRSRVSTILTSLKHKHKVNFI